MGVMKLADHILAVAHEKDKKVTNLQLQKILFFTIGIGIKNKVESVIEIKSNYNNDFSRWRYGPVVPEIYHKYNYYGYREIEDYGAYNSNYMDLNSIIEGLLSADVYKMVEISHKMKAWKDYEEKILNRQYVPRYEFWEIERDFKNAV